MVKACAPIALWVNTLLSIIYKQQRVTFFRRVPLAFFFERAYNNTMQTEQDIVELLSNIAAGTISPAEAAKQLRYAPFTETVNGITPDTHREMRTGFAETVFAQGKSNEVLVAAVSRLCASGTQPVLVTRVQPEQGDLLTKAFASGYYYPAANIFSYGKQLLLSEPFPQEADALVVSAGSADANVALEAFATLQFNSLSVALAQDIGVCGLHRIKPWLPRFDAAKVIIVVAGMEGALPSVIAGLTKTPVVAVPTSVGYGANLGGITTLLSMLSSCAPGISVVNIDNGYGAAMFAAKILQKTI